MVGDKEYIEDLAKDEPEYHPVKTCARCEAPMKPNETEDICGSCVDEIDHN